MSHTQTFSKMRRLQPRRFNRGNMWMRYGVTRFLAGWSACFVFDILQIPSGFVQICSGRNAPTCSPLVTGLERTHGLKYHIKLLNSHLLTLYRNYIDKTAIYSDVYVRFTNTEYKVRKPNASRKLKLFVLKNVQAYYNRTHFVRP